MKKDGTAASETTETNKKPVSSNTNASDLNVCFEKIPQELKDLKQWVMWKVEPGKDGKKPTKVPYTIGDRRASTIEPAHWNTFTACRAAYNIGGFSGLGFVFVDNGGYVGVDWDNVRNSSTGKFDTGVRQEILRIGSYAEISQSGRGAHVIYRGTKPGTKCRKGAREMYDSARFFVMTGNMIEGSSPDVKEADVDAIQDVYDKIDLPKNTPQQAKAVGTPICRLSDEDVISLCGNAQSGDTFKSLYNIGSTAVHGSHSEADLSLCSRLAFYTQDEEQIDRLFCGSGLYREKWNRPDYKKKTIETAINGLSNVYTPAETRDKNVFTQDVTSRVSAEYSFDGTTWGIKLTIDGRKGNQATNSKKSFDDNSDTRKNQLKDILKLMSKSSGNAIEKDALDDIVFNIMEVGATMVGPLITANKKSAESTESIENLEIEDTSEDGISDDVKKRAKAKAMEIMKTGDPIKEVVKIISKIHVGDERPTEVMCLGLASQSCLNTQGIQTSTVGGSGAGKSHNAKAFVHSVRSKYIMETSLTPKALYYTDIKPGTIVFSDDAGIDEEMEIIIKRATTNFQETTKHTTVVRHEGKTMTIPPRLMFILTSVESEGTIQLLNRQITLNVDESKSQKDKIFIKQNEDAVSGESSILMVTEDILIAREIHDIIKKKLFNVVVPFAEKIHVADKTNARNYPLFLDMVKSYAIYQHLQRDTNEKGYLIADIEDFKSAKILFESQQDNILTKLNTDERNIIRAIGQNGTRATVNEIVRLTKISYSKVLRLLNGRKERGTEGLLDRFTDLTYIEHSDSVKGGNTTFHTRRNYYELRNYNPVGMFDGEYVTLEDG